MEQTDAYRRAVASQLAQFPDAETMHDLPPIFHYWAANYLVPRNLAVFGGKQYDEIFARNIIEAVDRRGIKRVLSIGAGDGAQEIALMRAIRAHSRYDISILVTDLSAALIEQAKAKIEGAALHCSLDAQQCDVNVAFPDGQFAAVIVIDALHHMVELERLFENIARAIGEDGIFIARDMIGRNGHMRWPEVLEPLRQIWETLPNRLKYHSRNKVIDKWFENFDCSTEGFEGVRAQDILPLLVEHFAFKAFLAYGSFIEVFIERNFGPNFDPLLETDRVFIERLQTVEDDLLDKGLIRPTIMCAVMQSKRANRPAPKIWNSLMPEDAVRDPAMAFPPADVSSFHSPYLKEQPFNLPCHIRLGEEVKFEESSMGAMALLWGWHAPEPHIWSYGEDSALMLRLGPELFDEGDFVTLHFCTYGYVAENLGPQTLDIIVNGETKGRAVHTAEAQYAETAVALERPSHPHALVRFRPSYVRNADRDGGADKRAIGFVLVKLRALRSTITVGTRIAANFRSMVRACRIR